MERRAWRGLGLIGVVLAFGCSTGSEPSASVDAATHRVANPDGSSSQYQWDSAIIIVESDAQNEPPDAGPQPIITCGGEAGAERDAASESGSDAGAADGEAGTECPLPPSHCYDTRTLLYYEGGACVGGICQFEQKFYDCSLGAYCENGGCFGGPTL
jgi:hypothetical protein